MNDVGRRLRERMAEKATQDREFAGYALSLCARARKKPVGDLWRELGGNEDTLYGFALCRRPKEGEDAFRREVEQIASYVGVDAPLLASLFREAAVLESLARDGHTMDPAAILWAAREEDNRFGDQDSARDG